MSVDIISQVMNAADSKLQQVAHRRLEKTQTASVGLIDKIGQAFQKAAVKQAARLPELDLVAQVMSAADPAQREVAVGRLGTTEVAGAEDSEIEAKQKLEGQLMASLIETMLPKTDGGLYGSGTAGDVWRGFHAQEIGKTVAEGGESLLGLTDDAPARRPREGVLGGSGQWPYFQVRTITPYAG